LEIALDSRHGGVSGSEDAHGGCCSLDQKIPTIIRLCHSISFLRKKQMRLQVGENRIS
jgi:hypothetical protein